MLFNKLGKVPHAVPAWLIMLLTAVLSLLVVAGEAADQTATQAGSATATATVPATAIPQAEIATQATDASNWLGTLTGLAHNPPAIETIQKLLPVASARLEASFAETQRTLQQQPTLETLQAQQQFWQRRQLEASSWLSLLTQQAVELRAALDQLAALQKTWLATREAAQAAQVPAPLLQQIETVLAELAAARPPLQGRQDGLLDLQGQVAQTLARCNAVLAQITQAQQSAVGGLLTPNQLPVWNRALWQQLRDTGSAPFNHLLAEQWRDLNQYLQDPASGLLWHLGLFVVLALLLHSAQRQVHRWETAGESLPVAITVFDYPYATALLVSLLVASSPHLDTPPAIRNLFVVLGLLPMLRLGQPLVDRRLLSGLYGLAALYAFDTLREVLGSLPLIEHVLLLLETGSAMALLGWLLRRGGLRHATEPVPAVARLSALRTGAGLLLIVLAVALVAGSLGYLRLARLLVSSLLSGGILALALAVGLRLLRGVVVLVLRLWPLRKLYLVQRHYRLLEQRSYRLLIWLAIGVWLTRWLDYIGLFEPALSLGETILAARFERGSISCSVGDVVAFFLTVWIAYLLSAAVRFLLHEEVNPRKNIPPGSSYAIASLLHYVILALGFVIGLGVLGVDLDKITVLLSAFGVGIGFGLQTLVNNFVSGLVLLFERPVHVGDTIEIGDLLGEVRRIGIRASTVRTWKGSDIIVPNAQFITANVTNWTLKDRRRRIDLPVNVNYRADPQAVIALIEAAARNHPHILATPPPQAFFTSYGDSAINFELWAWTDQFDNWPRIRSDLTVAVYEAVYAAGLSFPFPQREVRLLRDAESDKAPAASPAVPSESSPSPPPVQATAGKTPDH